MIIRIGIGTVKFVIRIPCIIIAGKTLLINASVIDFASILYYLRFKFDDSIEQPIIRQKKSIVSIAAHI